MMLGKQTSGAIYGEWQSEIETKLEAGQTPLLDLTGSNLILADLPLLMALRAFVEQRADVTTPLILAGGNGPLWCIGLMLAHTTHTTRRPPDPIIVFAGADQVSYLATLTTLTPMHQGEFGRLAGAAPANMLPLFMPDTQAKAALPWESLPFAMTEETQIAAHSPDNQLAAFGDTWVGWTAIGLAIGMILLAFIIQISH